MSDIDAIFIAGVMPMAIVTVVTYFRYKAKQLVAGKGVAQKELEAARADRLQLEARVQNLESIVCSVDLELNGRLNRLAAQASAIGLLPAAQPSHREVVEAAPFTAPPVGLPGVASPFGSGQKIGNRYVLERELGHGGMGFVFLAFDEKLGERVALKVVSSSLAQDPAAAAERFRREVAAARKVTHPNVIRIHDLVENGDQLLLSMEYVEGMTLATHLGRVGTLRLDEAKLLLGQICDGLGAAHAAGVVHRDLKPGNILIDAHKQVKVIDFGLAKANFMAGMTATGLILGTPEYMSPEQVRGLECDARSDLYSLGAVAYHMLTGRPPFIGETPIAIGFAHVTEQPRAPRELRPDLPEEVDAALLRALDKDPEKRFRDAAEMKRALS